MTVTKDDVVESAVVFMYEAIKNYTARELLIDCDSPECKEALEEYKVNTHEYFLIFWRNTVTFEEQRIQQRMKEQRLRHE